MSYEEIYNQLSQLVAERFYLEQEDIKPETTFQHDLGADSLDIVELVMALEDQFGLQIDDEDAEKILTVGDAAHYIDEQRRSA
ncbi:MAG TPA: acyl carrier protein [Bavariicoccus seileri]|uniref:Acyl carrier protein n=1 Tax=Bavariicoccus seileri TaxID=549685 RepID=A0A3D4S3X0_9ENTE|nr:acyl carrier protein [Bavariicoccus seileri]HCS93440.1 acyl carrier protein [Bavariicoccus seileri]